MTAREHIESIQDPEIRARAYRAFKTCGTDLEEHHSNLAHVINRFSWSSTPDCYLWCKLHTEYLHERNYIGQFEEWKGEMRQEEERVRIATGSGAVTNQYQIY